MKQISQDPGLSSSNPKVWVYYLLDPDTKTILYIGRSFHPKKRKLVFERRNGRATEFGLFQRHANLESASKAEVKAIAKHWPPYNKHLVSSLGNTGNAGEFHHSAETRRQMRNSHLGQKHRTETKEKIRTAALGNKARLGKLHTEATKKKIRESLLARRDHAHQV